MKWFEGDIPRAIQQAKSNRSIFIVFIAGEDEKSREMELFLHKEDVTGVVEENNCVAVKLLANSNECKFFSQIYPVVVIPSIFFIADTGVPVEVIGECKSHEDFFAKVKNAVEKPTSAPAGNRPQTSSNAQQPQKSSAKSQDAVTPVEAKDELEDQFGGTDDDAVLGATGGAENGDGNEDKSTDKPSLEQRVDKAKQLVEHKREEKSRKEAEDEKRREVERRNIGQGVQKLRQQQKEIDLLEAKKELKRDREEDKIARQRVKDDIERDRAEKAARFNRDKDEKAKIAEEAKKKKLMEQQAAQADEQARRNDTARIQFRLPDGSSVTHTFSSTDTFATVHQFITQHTGTAVTLSMTFPRRTFTPEDHNLTLQELQLVPSAAIMVIPAGVSTSVIRSSSGIFSFSGIRNLLLAPVWFLWNIIGSLLTYTGLSSFATATAPTNSKRSTSLTSARGGDRDSGSAKMRPTTSSRQDGPIRRFHNADDDEPSDEDRATWNGNSTQQM